MLSPSHSALLSNRKFNRILKKVLTLAEINGKPDKCILARSIESNGVAQIQEDFMVIINAHEIREKTKLSKQIIGANQLRYFSQCAENNILVFIFVDAPAKRDNRIEDIIFPYIRGVETIEYTPTPSEFVKFNRSDFEFLVGRLGKNLWILRDSEFMRKFEYYKWTKKVLAESAILVVVLKEGNRIDCYQSACNMFSESKFGKKVKSEIIDLVETIPKNNIKSLLLIYDDGKKKQCNSELIYFY